MSKAIFFVLLIAWILSGATYSSGQPISYIYSGDSSSAIQYKSLLENAGYTVELIRSSDTPAANFSKYDLIIIGSDTGYLSSTDVDVNKINSYARPVIGIGEGGYAYFGKLGLRTGYGNGAHGKTNSIYVIDPGDMVFITPNHIDIPANMILQLYSSTESVEIYLSSIPSNVIVLGKSFLGENRNDTYYPFTLENYDQMLWGFSASPAFMTQNGKDLFINSVNSLTLTEIDDIIYTPEPTPTPTPQPTPSPLPTLQTTPTPSPTQQPPPGPSPTRQPTPTPSPTRQTTPTPLPTLQTTPGPSPTLQITPSPSPTRQPTPSPKPTWQPTSSPAAALPTPGITPTIVLPETTSIDMSKIVEDEIKKLASGQILFNPSKEMTVGKTERIEVRISKLSAEDLSVENFSRGVRGPGEPIIEEIKVGTFMKVHLTGEGFLIKSLSNEEQIVTEEGFTQWEFDVTPAESGIRYLQLAVTVRIKIPGGEEKRDLPVLERPIHIRVNPAYSTEKFFEVNWQWILTTFIGLSVAVIGWHLNKKKRSKKKK